MRDLIRGTALKNFDVVVRECGGAPDPMLAALGVRAETLDDAEAYIPFRTMAALVDTAAAQLGRPDFALELAARQDIDILGPIALIALHSPTAADAIADIARYMPVYSPALELELAPHGATQMRYRFFIRVPLQSTVQTNELGIGVSFGVFALLIGAGFRPVRVNFSHSPASDPRRYRDYFGCPVVFDADHCGFDVRVTDMTRRRPQNAPEVRAIVARYLETERGWGTEALSDRVAQLVTRMLASGHASAKEVAAQLGMDLRTMQRHLQKEGTTFAAVLDAVRRERARLYLSQSGLSLGQISRLLGYAEQSCLSRAMVRWYGTSPRAMRVGLPTA